MTQSDSHVLTVSDSELAGTCRESFSSCGLASSEEHNAQRSFRKRIYAHVFLEGFPQLAVSKVCRAG